MELRIARFSARGGALLGGFVVLGWCLHDLGVFATSGRPAEVSGLAGPWFVALFLGTLLGALCARRPVFALAGLFLALLWVAFAMSLRSSLSAAERLLPREVFLFLGAWILGARAGSSPIAGARAGSARLGISLGILGCILNARVHHVKLELSWWLGLAALAALALGFLRGAVLRRVATALVVLAPATRIGAEAWSEQRLPRADLAPPARAAGPGAKDLVLIVLDTVRADHLSFFGHGRETTPHIDAFAREWAVAYPQARSTCSETVPSHASLFAGLQPKPAQLLFDRPDEPFLGRVPLAERLRQEGYRTCAVLSNEMLTHSRGLDRGFEHYDDQRSSWVGDYLALGQICGESLLFGHKPYREGRIITDRALAWIDSLADEGAFFLVLNYMDAHGPYIPPPPYDRFFAEGAPRDPLVNDAAAERELFPLLYDRELRYLDEQVGRLLSGLEERGLFEETVVILTADHGEAFGEHDFWVHGWMLYDELIHVPLFVKPAGARSETTREEPASGAEIYGIALDELGLAPLPPVPAATSGEWNYIRMRPSMLTDLPRESLERDLVTWLEDGVKFIVSSKGVVEAYDLEQDPGERSPLPLDATALEAARERARRWWQEYPRPQRKAPELDAETLRRMGGLGYVDEGSK